MAACRAARRMSSTATGRGAGASLRAVPVVLGRARRRARATCRARAADASACVQARPAGTSSMQSTGQGATHSSQPEHSDGSTACMRLAPPMIASTGQAAMHNVQPMHRLSSMTATASGACTPHASSRGDARSPVSAARASMVAAPPGGHRLIGAALRAMAAAYGAQPSKPQRVHWVCGNSASMASAVACIPAFYRGTRERRPQALGEGKTSTPAQAHRRWPISRAGRACGNRRVRETARREVRLCAGWPGDTSFHRRAGRACARRRRAAAPARTSARS